LIIAIPLGLLYVFTIPVGRSVDEPTHYYRAYDISQGKFVSDSNENGGGAEVSIKYQEAIRKENVSYVDYSPRLSITASNEDEKEFVLYGNTAIYFFTCYLPQSVGIFIGDLLHSPILVGAYLGRLFNLLFFILVIFFSIKKIPVLKSAIFFVSLLPMMLHQAASLSSEVMTYIAAVGLFAFVMYHLYRKTKAGFTIKDYIIMCTLCVLLGMCKYAYLPLCLIVLIIPMEKFGTKRRKYLSIGLLAGGIIIMNIIWFFIAKDLLKLQQLGGYDVNSQLQYILHNPIKFIVAIMNTVAYKGWSTIGSAVGANLEWFDVGINDLLVSLVVIVFCFSIYRYREVVISPSLKHAAIFIFIITTIGFIVIEYLTWTPMGANYVDGIQGRYFLPMLFMVPLFFMKTSKKQSLQQTSVPKLQKIDQSMSFVFFLFIVAVNLVAISSIFIHHLPL
ncbi:DUF2142 domain-containing protein, partial [Candidatus Saccharibacteria bacterium]|nr:DUF2142 domain-containing protein [Candidatus Saccharibacteria bacterium]